MKNIFSLFKIPQEESSEQNTEHLTQESAIKALEMEISDRDQTIKRIKNELSRLREDQQQTVRDLTDSALKDLFEELAPQLSQLQTQRYLVIEQEKPLPPRHTFSIFDQMQRVLSKYGLEFVDRIGETVSYNPDHHSPLNLQNRLVPGVAVVIRFPGLSYRGLRIRRAGVEPVAVRE